MRTQDDITGSTVEWLAVGGGRTAILTIQGRSALNVVGRETMERCVDELGQLARDDGIQCIVLRGPTPRAFVGGADLEELGSLDEHSAEVFIRSIHRLCEAIRLFPAPVIARVQGYCLGAGLEIAAACDFRIADGTAQCGMPEVRVGVPSVIEAALLPMLVGWGKTRELLYRGHIVDAEEGRRIGLLDELAPNDELDQLVHDVIADLGDAGPNAIRLQKKLIQEWESSTIDEAIEAGVDAFVAAYRTDEPRRYIDRFFARRNMRKNRSEPSDPS